MAGDIPDVYLRFDGFTGECNDLQHPGDEGWITIRSFTFGFGFPGKDGSSEALDDNDEDSHGHAGPGGNGANARQRPKRKKHHGSMKSGPMTFDNITFSKSSDTTSHQLMEWCHEGKEVDEVELHACRYGGAGGDEKLTFLQFTFEGVHLKSCKLNLATDNLPTEDVEFTYDKVYMECLWTDNATGNRLTSQPISVGWDIPKHESLDEEPADDGAP